MTPIFCYMYLLSACFCLAVGLGTGGVGLLNILGGGGVSLNLGGGGGSPNNLGGGFVLPNNFVCQALFQAIKQNPFWTVDYVQKVLRWARASAGPIALPSCPVSFFL